MTKKNDVLIVESEFNRLMKMAEAMEQKNPVEAEPLLIKLDGALTIADNKAPETLIHMGSIVTYSIGTDEKTITMVFPAEANIDEGLVAVTSPLGVALLGRKSGYEATMQTRDGKKTPVKIVDVKTSLKAAA